MKDLMQSIRFNKCKTEADIWMRENNRLYEYIAVYADDLLIAARNPNEIVNVLTKNHKFKRKGIGLHTYCLGCDYFQDKDGKLCHVPRKYISNMIGQFNNMFGCWM
jgi:Reverse transcriptase (RNA-dependent DNA polymerase)